MANEARVSSLLAINAGNVQYSSLPSAFTADVTGRKGPVPGAFTATTAGVDVDLSELTTPGLYRVMNLDATNFVEIGIRDADGFLPFHEIMPGETYVGRFSRNLLQEYIGTGTTGSIHHLHVKANTASCNVVLEAFEK